jgi:hypothetical protein
VNILDENLPEPQCEHLREKRIAFRKIGPDIARKGLTDREIVALLHELDRPTFFTLDKDFFRRRLCHARYCLIHLNIVRNKVAAYVRRVLKHPQLKTRAKRMGLVLSASPDGLVGWRVSQQALVQLTW